MKRYRADFYSGKQVDFVTIGKKGNDVISKMDKVIINDNQIYDHLHFDDAALVHLLLQQLKAKQVIDPQADSSLNTYIKSKLPLIRDTAEGRLSFGQGGNH